MSIQQSINQAISGSLYLLGQSTLFRTLKEERDEKIRKEKNKIDSVLNKAAVPVVAGNEPIPQTPAEQQTLNESTTPDQQEGTMAEESTPKRDFPYAQQIAEFDLQKHLESRVAEAARAEQLAKAFRDHISGGGDTLG